MDLQLLQVVFNASIFETGDKRRPMDNKLEHFTQKKKVAVKHSCSARDQIPGRVVFNSFPFSSFHTSDRGNRPFFSGERYLKTCFLVRV